MKRTFIMVLDSFGIGASADANKFGDQGADTLGHIAEVCARGEPRQKDFVKLTDTVRPGA